MEKMIEFLSSWLKSAPKWVKIVVPLVIAGVTAIYLLSSCSAIRQMEVERRQTREIKDTTTVRLVTSDYKRSVVYRASRARSLPYSATPTTADRPLYVQDAAASAAAGTQAATARRCIRRKFDRSGASVTTILMPSP
nr:MAG TPA_asm: hypothetical protein [Microviridae sp.]